MRGTSQLDQAYTILSNRLSTAAGSELSISEPLFLEAPVGVGGPLHTLTLHVGGEPFALLGLTSLDVGVSSAGLIAYLGRRARARRVSYMVVSNLRDAWLLPVPRHPHDIPDPLRRYPLLYQITLDGRDPLSLPEHIALAERADKIAADLLSLRRDGSLGLVVPDADFFVDRLMRAVEVLKPSIKRALRTKLRTDAAFGQELVKWAMLQSIPANLRSDDFVEAVVRQAIYRLLGKIIFYQSLRRVAPHLPSMDLAGLGTAQVLVRLRDCFAAALEIDYHAVFREDVVDRLPFPAVASLELRDLVGDLNTRDFANLPQDVMGAVFEGLIPPEDRHRLGQYFTPEPLVDLIIGFCVRNAEDMVLDPTCGTGTFLVRAYDRLRTRLGIHNHRWLLSQLWGVDIASFPAELATINLFRQRIDDSGNFPRIVKSDFFKIAPDGMHRFPPLKASVVPVPGEEQSIQADWVEEPIPVFDAIVGNFPYISADRIDRAVKGYRKSVEGRLAREWLGSYPDGFTFKRKTDEKAHRLARKNGLALEAFLDKAKPIISTYADLYVYLFWHAAAFLKEGGRMGMVTSNAWLDVGYGHALQQFLLDHFKIVAILESRCEPWFEESAVNTVITILERCGDPAERDTAPVHFVKVKRRLSELIPWDLHLDALNRWLGLDGLVARVESVWEASDDPAQPLAHEDDDFRIRSVRQGALRRQVKAASQTVKWGRYLRAPDVYFDLLREAGVGLALLRDIAPPSFGSKTGNNEFYHFDDARAAEWDIEPEFLFPLLKSPGETDRILIDEADLRLKVFICRLSKDDLRRWGKTNALRYIEWGERQVFASGRQAGLTWPHGAEVRNRKPGWYALPKYRSRPAQLFFASAYGDRHIHKYSSKPLIADKRLYFLSPSEGVSHELAAAIMNTGVVALLTEVAGRVTMGDGALELTVEDARDYLHVPDVRSFDDANRDAIVAAFQPLLKRPIGSVFEEVKKADRQALDGAVLRAMGLEPKEWLLRLYDGLTTLVRERMQLGRMRAQARRSRPRRAAERVAEQILQDLLPHGPARFPDAFFSHAARTGAFREIVLPQTPLRHVGHYFGKEDLVSEDGQTLTVSPFEARYILFAQQAGRKVVRLPEKPVEVSRTVSNYVQWLRDLRRRLREAYFNRTLDQVAAERFVGQVWQQLSLPQVEE